MRQTPSPRPCSSSARSPGLTSQALRFERHVIRAFDGVERPAELGRLTVPARRQGKAAGAIELAVIRLASTATAPDDPIVFLMGGPGIPTSVMAQVPVYAQLFDRLRSVADVVLLDQRGTGLSRPALECPARDTPLGADAFERRSTLLAEMLTELRACVASWRAKGVDEAAYTSGENAADVVDPEPRSVGSAQLLRSAMAPRWRSTTYPHGASYRVRCSGRSRTDHQLKLPSVFDR
jgi:hypothetical protein